MFFSWTRIYKPSESIWNTHYASIYFDAKEAPKRRVPSGTVVKHQGKLWYRSETDWRRLRELSRPLELSSGTPQIALEHFMESAPKLNSPITEALAPLLANPPRKKRDMLKKFLCFRMTFYSPIDGHLRQVLEEAQSIAAARCDESGIRCVTKMDDIYKAERTVDKRTRNALEKIIFSK